MTMIITWQLGQYKNKNHASVTTGVVGCENFSTDIDLLLQILCVCGWDAKTMGMSLCSIFRVQFPTNGIIYSGILIS